MLTMKTIIEFSSRMLISQLEGNISTIALIVGEKWSLAKVIIIHGTLPTITTSAVVNHISTRWPNKYYVIDSTIQVFLFE